MAVAAVAISGLTLWDSHQERVRSEEKAQASASAADSEAATLTLRGTPDSDGARLSIAPLGEGQVIQTQSIGFPTALGLSPITTTGDPRIEADWFADALKRTLKAAGEKEDAPGDRQLPLVLTTHFMSGGKRHVSWAIYDVGYALDGRFLRGTAVILRGMSIVAPVSEKTMQGRLDRLWNGRHPAIAK